MGETLRFGYGKDDGDLVCEWDGFGERLGEESSECVGELDTINDDTICDDPVSEFATTPCDNAAIVVQA